MDLKLTEHVRIPFPFFICKNWGKSDIWNFFSEKINFGLYFAENRHLQVHHFLLRHCDVMTSYVGRCSWSWYQWKEETLPYTMVPNIYTLDVSFLSWGGGNQENVLKNSAKIGSSTNPPYWLKQAYELTVAIYKEKQLFRLSFRLMHAMLIAANCLFML